MANTNVKENTLPAIKVTGFGKPQPLGKNGKPQKEWHEEAKSMYEMFLSCAEEQKKNGHTHHEERPVDEVIKDYKQIIAMYENPTFIKEFNSIWDKKI